MNDKLANKQTLGEVPLVPEVPEVPPMRNSLLASVICLPTNYSSIGDA